MENSQNIRSFSYNLFFLKTKKYHSEYELLKVVIKEELLNKHLA
jgi:hypothetical protein